MIRPSPHRQRHPAACHRAMPGVVVSIGGLDRWSRFSEKPPGPPVRQRPPTDRLWRCRRSTPRAKAVRWLARPVPALMTPPTTPPIHRLACLLGNQAIVRVLPGEPFKTVAKNSVLVNAKSRELNLGFFRVNTAFFAVCGATPPLAFVSVLPVQCTGKLVSGSLPRQDNGNSRTLSVNNDAPVNRIRRS